ncbi:twin-arginine translocase TatA/TatE family subunit [uncultured Methylobacterium sp.]|uniref:twin-arginine translocase TatA/TatE family subunit n=1 Tax=uncultured Methylobacterium sp. TaxID=157278 RepID=UPI0035CC042A
MGSMSIWHWVIVAVIVMLLFGRGKVSDLMGDVAKGIKAFKKGMAEDETPAQAAAPVAPVAPAEPVRTIPHAAETSPGTAIPASHLPSGDRKTV